MDAILTNSSTRDTLLLAVYAAQRRAFSRPAILGALQPCGLWPIDEKLMLASARINLGMVDAGETAVEAARSAAALVIQDAQGRVDKANVSVVDGRVVVTRGVVHAPFHLLDNHRKVQAEAAKELADNDARRVD